LFWVDVPNSLLTENGRSESAIRRNHQQLGQLVSGQILTHQDKSTMNLFAIDSRRELREDMLGPSYAKTQNEAFFRWLNKPGKTSRRERCAMEYGIVDGKQTTDMEREKRHGQQLEDLEIQAPDRVQREAAALVRKLEQTYDALDRLMAQNPEVTRQITKRASTDEEFHRKLRRGLELADAAPRCRWVRQDGTSCGSPGMKKHIYCFAHKQMMEARALALSLPAPEDANAIQIGIMRIQKALIEGTISTKMAGLLLYSMQLALQNVGQMTFGKANERDMATNLMDEQDALAEERDLPLLHTADTDRKGWESFTGEDAEPPQQAKTGLAGGPGGAKENQGIQPRTNADELGLITAGRDNGISSGILKDPPWDKPTPKWDAVG
jgi:hypothetical protein